MKDHCLRIAIVGHTNTGKTSLVRTLGHDRHFGQVRDQSGTTRRIERLDLRTEQGACLELHDSPGLENAPQLLDWLEARTAGRHDGPQRIRSLLGDRAAVTRFAHEAQVLGLMLEMDVGLYVIDAREPVLEKYQDELAVLALCARPLLAVLNFVATPESRETHWREALARVGLHTVLSLDAAVRDPETELELFEKLRSMLDAHASLIKAWLVHRRAEERARRHAALETIADLLLDAAAWQQTAAAEDAADQQRVRQHMQHGLRQREQACLETLLELYRFGHDVLEVQQSLPLGEGRWRADLFDPQTLRHYGLRTTGHAAAGAGIGALVDVATGGLSLGTGTAVGAAVGAAAGLASSASKRLRARFRGQVLLHVEDAILHLLLARSLELLLALTHRGHGSPDTIRLAQVRRVRKLRLPAALRRARHRPGWSSLGSGGSESPSRRAAQAALVEDLDALAVAPVELKRS